MFGNGVVIGMIVIITAVVLVVILRELRRALTAFFVAVAGSTHLPSAGQRIVATATRTAAATTAVSA